MIRRNSVDQDLVGADELDRVLRANRASARAQIREDFRRHSLDTVTETPIGPGATKKQILGARLTQFEEERFLFYQNARAEMSNENGANTNDLLGLNTTRTFQLGRPEQGEPTASTSSTPVLAPTPATSQNTEPGQTLEEPAHRPPQTEWIQTIVYKDIKDLIPSYGGDPAKLEHYISTADTLYLQLSDDRSRKMFLLAIRSKLRDRAYDAIKTSAEPAGWRHLRQALREKIAPISPEHAYSLLGNAKQNNNETIGEYSTRIEAMLTTLNRATADPAPLVAREHIRNNNMRLAKKSFEYGLSNSQIRTIVISGASSSLATATQLAMELEATNRFEKSARPQHEQGQHDNRAIICNFCQKRGHKAEVCRKKAAAAASPAQQTTPASNQSRPAPPNTSQKTCHYCKKPGHIIAECRKRMAAESKKGNTTNSSANTRKAIMPSPDEDPDDQQPQTFTLEDLRRELSKN